MFSILFAWLFIRLAKANQSVTVDGLYILIPIIADCYVINIFLDFLA
tara:strand:- start:34 stop:174 length:141 start_codon:yes stop_codon:yes gene_type:complete